MRVMRHFGSSLNNRKKKIIIITLLLIDSDEFTMLIAYLPTYK